MSSPLKLLADMLLKYDSFFRCIYGCEWMSMDENVDVNVDEDVDVDADVEVHIFCCFFFFL